MRAETDLVRRAVARWSTWWIRLFVASVIGLRFTGWAWWIELAIPVGLLLLAFVRPPWKREREPETVAAPVRGRWVAVNSPATKVPSHGIRAYGQTYAIDVLHPSPPGTPARPGWGLGMRPAGTFSTFGEPVYAVADGVVVATASRQRDHRSRVTWPSLVYLLVVEAFARELGGIPFIFGNHAIVDHGDGIYAAYAHLHRGSLRVAPGDRVAAGEQLGEVGNSGNSSEPHLHVQLMDRPRPTEAAGVPFRWEDIDIPGDRDPARTVTPDPAPVVPGLPADGQVFTASAPD